MRTFARTICGFATLLLALLFFDCDAAGNVRYLTDSVGTITDTYDANGNTLMGAGFGQSQSDQYDFENRLIRRTGMVNGQPTTINVIYDGDGNRVCKTVTTSTNTVTTYYLVDDLNPSGNAQVLEERIRIGNPVYANAG